MGQQPQTRLRAASVATKSRLWALLQRCLQELAALTSEPLSQDTQGQAAYPYFDRYWQEPDRHPFGVWFGSSLAGLCLLRDIGVGRWQVAEFWVEPGFRRRGIGTSAVHLAAAWCAGQGGRVLEARVHPRNGPALAFWARAGFVRVASEDERAVFERELASAPG